MSYVLNSDSAGASRPDPPDQHRPPKLNLAFPACLSQSRLTGGIPSRRVFNVHRPLAPGLWTLDIGPLLPSILNPSPQSDSKPSTPRHPKPKRPPLNPYRSNGLFASLRVTPGTVCK